MGLKQAADGLYAYVGASATGATNFLAAVSAGSFSVAEGMLAGTGLVVGTSAVQLSSSSDFGQYSGTRAGKASFAAYASLVNNIANWQDLGDGSYATLVPATTGFTISPLPELGSLALTLAGLGLVGVSARGRVAR